MRYFKDNQGREWGIEFNGENVERLAEHELALDLYDVVDEKRAEDFYRRLSHPRTFIRALCFILADSAPPGFTASDFGRAMGGDAIDNASDAWHQAAADFFPRTLRPIMEAARGKILDIEKRAAAAAVETINSDETNAAIDKALTLAKGKAAAVVEQSLAESAARSFGS